MPIKKVPFTDAREALSSLIDEVQKSGQAIAITRHGKPAAVLISMDALEQKIASQEKRSWKLRNSGTWLDESVDIDETIRKIRSGFRTSGEGRMNKLSRKLRDK
jgi:prevent-host-death family protein